MAVTTNSRPRETRTEALRQIEFATSMAVALLSDLDRTRLQIRTLKDTDSGMIIVPPESIDLLIQSVERVQHACRNIKPIRKR